MLKCRGGESWGHGLGEQVTGDRPFVKSQARPSLPRDSSLCLDSQPRTGKSAGTLGGIVQLHWTLFTERTRLSSMTHSDGLLVWDPWFQLRQVPRAGGW